jgi:hypothetical protein
MERVKGIEPSSVAWEATALPLSYTRSRVRSLFRARTGTQCGAASTAPHPACMNQKLPLTVANTPELLPPFWATVVLKPISASSPNSCVRAPNTAVP